MSKLSTLSAAALLATSLGANATITQLFAPGDMATSFVNDFETTVNAGPATFNAGTQLFSACGAASCVTPSGTQGLLSASFPDSIVATLSGGYQSVGMYFGNDDRCCSGGFDAVLSVYSGATLLGSVSVTANMNDHADQFIGLSSTVAFDKVEISYSGAGLFNYIDDFRVGAPVPEPGTYALMLAGLVGVGLVARRRKA